MANFRRSIKVVNPASEILFEDNNGELTDIFVDSVPYDLDADVIEIDDVIAVSSMWIWEITRSVIVEKP